MECAELLSCDKASKSKQPSQISDVVFDKGTSQIKTMAEQVGANKGAQRYIRTEVQESIRNCIMALKDGLFHLERTE